MNKVRSDTVVTRIGSSSRVQENLLQFGQNQSIFGPLTPISA